MGEYQSVTPHVFLKARYAASPLDPHTHDFHHMIYVLSGSGQVYIDGKLYVAKPGNLFLIAPDTVHTLGSPELMTTYEFKFTIHDEFCRQAVRKVEDRMLFCTEEVATAIANTSREAKQNQHYMRQMVALMLPQVLLMLARSQETEDAAAEETQPERVLEKRESLATKIKAFLDCNYTRELTAQDIADHFFISEAHMRRTFAGTYHISPIKYINNLRIEQAKKLMETTDMSITEISEAVGFATLHYFSRCFTTTVMISPVKYKAAVKDCYVITFH